MTSYDYYAPLNEAGDRTENYYKIRDEFIKHDVPVPPLTAKDSEKAAYGRIDLSRRAFLFDNLGEKHIKSPYPLTMEEVGQNYGYIYIPRLCRAVWNPTDFTSTGLRTGR